MITDAVLRTLRAALADAEERLTAAQLDVEAYRKLLAYAERHADKRDHVSSWSAFTPTAPSQTAVLPPELSYGDAAHSDPSHREGA